MQGTGYVYATMLRPYVAGHESDIERKLLEWRDRAWDLAIYYWQNCTDLGQNTILDVLEYVRGQSTRSSSNANAQVNSSTFNSTFPAFQLLSHL